MIFQSLFSGKKIREKIVNLSSVDLAQRVVKAAQCSTDYLHKHPLGTIIDPWHTDHKIEDDISLVFPLFFFVLFFCDNFRRHHSKYVFQENKA